jgi:hypothetical protein
MSEVLPFKPACVIVHQKRPLCYSSLIMYTIARTHWVGDQLAVRPLPTQDNANTEWTQTNIMLRVGFEPTTPVFERAKTFHAVDPAAAVLSGLLGITV